MSDSSQKLLKLNADENNENNTSEDIKVDNDEGRSGLMSFGSISPDEDLNSHMNDVINEEVESAIKKVIEDSVQHVLVGEYADRGQEYADKMIMEALTQTVEESVQDVIQNFSMEEKDPKKKVDHTGPHTPCTMEPYFGHAVEFKHIGRDTNYSDLCDYQCSALLSSHHDHETISTVCSGSDACDTPCSSCLSQLEPGDTVKRLQSWKEAGKALREALSRFASSQQPSEDVPSGISKSDSSSSNLLLNGQQLGDIDRSADTDLVGDEASVINTPLWSTSADILHPVSPSRPEQDVAVCEKPINATEASLTRSMEQSFAWKNELDPMNQMWADYQSSRRPEDPHMDHSLVTQPVNSCSKCMYGVNDVSEQCESHSETRSAGSIDVQVSGESRFDVQAEVDTRSLSTSDPTLAELREKMRQLVATLPIMANQSLKVSPNRTSEIGLRTHRSPKNARRRHRRSSKEDPLVASDEEKESQCLKRIPPKSSKTAQRISKSDPVKVNCDKTKPIDEKWHATHNEIVSSQKEMSTGLHTSTDPMSNSLSYSSGEASSKHMAFNKTDYIKDKTSQAKSVIGCVRWSERSTETESGQTGTDIEGSDMKQTESMANFADIESCESEKEKRDMVPTGCGERSLRTVLALGDLDKVEKLFIAALSDKEDSMPSLESASSDEEVASLILAEKYSHKVNNVDNNTLSDEDLELFEDLPDLVLSTNSSTDDDAQLTLSHKEIESLQDIYITDSSDLETGVEGDDEFECDCSICQCPRENIEADTHSNDSVEDEDDQFGMRYLNDLSVEFRDYLSESDDDSSVHMQHTSALSPLGLLSTDSYRRDFLDLMFTNVIMHMLSVYPDLLNEQTPPPVPEDLFKSFLVVKVTQEHIDAEESCPICLCPFVLSDELKKLPCSHYFHPLCIQAWIQKAGTCPVCRHNLTLGPGNTNS